MTANDYDEVADLWRNTEGIGLDEHVDTREGIACYLARHPGLSFVARQKSDRFLECGDSSPLSAERSELPRDAATPKESGDESPHSKYRIVGAVLCGHDGRRGYLHHLAVTAPCRRQGIGQALVDACLTGLASVGIPKCNIFLLADNELGKAFWTHNGWNERCDLKVLQKETPSYTDPILKWRTEQPSKSFVGNTLRVLARALFQDGIRISPHFSPRCATAWHKQCPANRLRPTLLLRSSGTPWVILPVSREMPVRQKSLRHRSDQYTLTHCGISSYVPSSGSRC